MKKFYLLILLTSVSCLAQSNQKELEDLANAEKKGASKKMTFLLNPNTYNYDVLYHRIEVSVDPSEFFISGETTTYFRAKENLNTVVFDLTNNLSVSSVKHNGNDLAFSQASEDELVITLPATQNINVVDSLTITYSGAPDGSGFGSFITDEHNGTPVLWTLSEPFGARDWWPCKQDLNDKADNGIDVFITAPIQYVSLANGMQQSVVDNNNGTETTHFRHSYPIPAYLIAIACTNYEIYNQQGGLGTAESPFFPIVNYMYPETAETNIESLQPTPDIINFFENKFGAYPFRNEKYGHAQFGWGGGMEHTTVSFMTANGDGAYSRGLIAHEMGHQWFGDKVTCGSWRDIWLNEGFATYLASMVIEEFDGESNFIGNKNGMINSITNSNGGAIYMTEDEALDVNRIFSSRLSYNKGAMVLNMLRFKLGDTDFFQALNNYLVDTDHAYGYAFTPDLQSHLEAASGVNLTEFFNDWVYNQGFPIYTITANNAGLGQAQIKIDQEQSHPSVSFFEMPVPVRLFGSGSQQQDYVLENTSDGQIFTIDVPFTVTGVEFNPKRDLISKNSTATLATKNFDLSTAISLYPNPTTNKLNLNLPSGVTVQKTIFYNSLGQKAKETTTETSWDVSALSSGVYFINVISDAGTTQLKFVKK